MGRFPRLPLKGFERSGVAGQQSVARAKLAYCDLASDRQQRAYNIARKHHALTVSRVNRRNSASPMRCTRSPSSPWVVGHGCTTHVPPSAKA